MGRRIEEIATTEPFAEGMARLSALRDISTLGAMTIIAETCDFTRFGDVGAYMGFTGLTPSEHSSGASRHQGSISKTGDIISAHVCISSTPEGASDPSLAHEARRLYGKHGLDVRPC